MVVQNDDDSDNILQADQFQNCIYDPLKHLRWNLFSKNSQCPVKLSQTVKLSPFSGSHYPSNQS